MRLKTQLRRCIKSINTLILSFTYVIIEGKLNEIDFSQSMNQLRNRPWYDWATTKSTIFVIFYKVSKISLPTRGCIDCTKFRKKTPINKEMNYLNRMVSSNSYPSILESYSSILGNISSLVSVFSIYVCFYECPLLSVYLEVLSLLNAFEQLGPEFCITYVRA